MRSNGYKRGASREFPVRQIVFTRRQVERIHKKLEELGRRYGFDQKTARRLARLGGPTTA